MFVVDLEGIEEAKRQFGVGVIERAIYNALNKTASSASTAAKKAIRAEFNIKAGDLVKKNKATGELGRGPNNRQGMEVRKARLGQNEAFLVGFGSSLPLIHFGARPNTVEKDIMRKRRRGVTVMVKKSSGRSRLKHVFVARVPTKREGVNHIGLFERTGDDRIPLEQKYGPGVAGMLKEKIPQVENKIAEAAPEIFAHELEYQIMKAKGEVR